MKHVPTFKKGDTVVLVNAVITGIKGKQYAYRDYPPGTIFTISSDSYLDCDGDEMVYVYLSDKNINQVCFASRYVKITSPNGSYNLLNV
jgi:hypothetical protein